jgi:ribonuclease VapC
MKKVLDAYALMVYFEREAGYERIKEILAAAAEKDEFLLMTAVNYGEVYYSVLRECGQPKADEIDRIIDTFPVDIIDVDKDLAREAGKYKASKKMSYADCMAAALAKLHRAELITGDREFKEVEKEIKICWI